VPAQDSFARGCFVQQPLPAAAPAIGVPVPAQVAVQQAFPTPAQTVVAGGGGDVQPAINQACIDSFARGCFAGAAAQAPPPAQGIPSPAQVAQARLIEQLDNIAPKPSA